MDKLSEMFIRMIGTIAVILVVSALIGGSDILSRIPNQKNKWIYALIMGAIGGVFGIYGNISGFELNGAVVSVRDMGSMLAGFSGGPVAGIVAGIIAGAHRLTMGGITAPACVVATCSIGLASGFICDKWHKYLARPYFALLHSVLMEAFHLGVVLIMVKPFETALDIVKQIALPFLLVNGLGFALMVIIITYIERQRAIADERSRLRSELEVANVIQHSLLPLINEEYPGRRELDIGASMKAAKEVGGDFYDVFYVSQSRLAFVIGDVSGKGVPAALFMASAKIILQNCVRDIPALSDAVAMANDALCKRNDAEMFVTVWVGILDYETGELTYVSAGHNPPVIVRGGRPQYLKIKNGFVLGGLEGMKYKEQSEKLTDGDLVCLYTDGVTEAEDKAHNLYGEERLLACFENSDSVGASDMIERVKASVDSFVGGNSQFDDMTMLCFKWLGHRPEM